jgi:hypothetical protein
MVSNTMFIIKIIVNVYNVKFGMTEYAESYVIGTVDRAVLLNRR